MKRYLIILLAVGIACGASAQSFQDEISHYRAQHAESLKKSNKGPVGDEQLLHVRYFEPNSKFRVEAAVELLYNEPTFRMPTSDGTSKEFKRFAKLSFFLNEQPYILIAYENADNFQTKVESSYLFLPFLDNTTGESSYESGRYLDLSKGDIKGNKVMLDFNKAYNPYCAYSDGYRCPQPPAENYLNIAIEAGEKKYTGPKNQKEQDNSMAKNFTAAEKKIIQNGSAADKFYVLQTTVEADSIILRTLSEDAKFDDPLLPQLRDRMLLTVQDPEQGGVGIAAPQVGVNKNLIWVQRFDKADRPFEFFINPKIIWRSQLLRKGGEGCLSIPDRKEDIIRNYSIILRYQNAEGKKVEELIEGFTAVIFQHEVDHLYGILYPDRKTEQEQKELVVVNEQIEFSVEKGSILP